MNEDLLRQLQEVKDQLKKVEKGKSEEKESTENPKIFEINEESDSDNEMQHEISFSEHSNSNSSPSTM